MDGAKNTIALIAHDQKKDDMAAFAAAHADYLKGFRLVATGTTGGRILDVAPELPVERLKSGPLGGDQQIGALIATGDVAMVIFWCVYVIFPRMGGDYEAAVISAGYAGFAMGATPTAMANMSAVSKQFGAAPRAFIIIPLIGAFFIDVSNAFVIRILISLFGPGP